MADPDITYWDTSTSSSSDTTPTDDTTGTTTYYSVDTASTSSSPRVRRILVKTPENWDEETLKEYVKLVNEKTNTGWTVTMIIKGEVIITDPDVETRSMKNFIPLLKKRASNNDRRKIDNFFIRNPVET